MTWDDDTTPTARKQHRCNDCFRVIEAGESYRRVRRITDGGPTVYKSCRQCTAVLDEIWRAEDAACWEDGIDLGEYLTEYGIEPLLAQWRSQWAGVDMPDVAVLAGVAR